jgi:hypothetical protein
MWGGGFCEHCDEYPEFVNAGKYFRSVCLTKYYSSDQIQKNEMGEVCSMYEVHRAFVGKPEGM